MLGVTNCRSRLVTAWTSPGEVGTGRSRVFKYPTFSIPESREFLFIWERIVSRYSRNKNISRFPRKKNWKLLLPGIKDVNFFRNFGNSWEEFILRRWRNTVMENFPNYNNYGTRRKVILILIILFFIIREIPHPLHSKI